VRGAELLGLPVVGPGGEQLGKVLDVRLVQDGPLLGAYAALRVEGLIVGNRPTASRLGYDRFDGQFDVRGPWLLAVCVRYLTRQTRYLPWEEAELSAGTVRSRVGNLPTVPKIA
jgi:hypothetical protein